MSKEGTERRLTTILAADVVGYSRLMAADEAGTLAELKSHRRELIEPKAAQYHGRTIKLMGDGTLMEFASVVDAVVFAVEVQCAVQVRNTEVPEDRRIVYRIGINIGDIIVEGDDIYGDGVNIAARLEGLAEPGGVCISRPVHTQIKGKLDLTFEDLGAKEVKNIPEPVTVYRVAFDDKVAALVTPVVQEVAKRERRWWPVAAGAVAALVLAVGGALWWQPWAPDVEPASLERMAFPLPDKPSIAVLPFDNLSGDPRQDPLSDGMTEDIITELSRFRELFVIARHSTQTYKGKPVKVQQVAEDLGVRYVLEGSVRKTGDQIRINAQLIDATSGRHVWAERYDRDLTDLFSIQDEIVGTIVTSLAVKVHEAERARTRRKPTESLEAYDYFLRGRDLQFKRGFWQNEVNTQARGLYEKAAVLDPEFTRAYVELAWTHLYDFIYGWSAAPEQSRDRALQLSQQAVSMDASNARAHYALGYVRLYLREYDRAIAEIEKAIALNPNDARFRAGMSGLLVYAGKPLPAIEKMQEAMRLNPHHESWYFGFLAWAYFHAERYDEALATLEQIAEPDAGPHRTYAAIYARMDRLEEARGHAAKARELDPDFSVSQFGRSLPYAKRADLDFYLDALRKAGLPEQPPLDLPDKPSIAVLPFTNISGDAEQEYFADGMTEDLITDLSKISGLFVIARNSSFSYKGRQVKVRQVAEELGVRYVLEGSVRRAGDEVRINAQLIDATTGGHIWAERYDGSMADVFALQDKVTQKIITALAANLTAGEEAQRAQLETDVPEAYDAFLRGWAHYRLGTREDLAKAVPYLERAIELDPNYGRAHAALAAVYMYSWSNEWVRSLGVSFQEAWDISKWHLDKAMGQPTPLAHRVLSRVLTSERKWERAVAEAERAIALNVNDPEGYVAMARILIKSGKPAESLQYLNKAMRLDPETDYLWWLGSAQFHMERFDEAAATMLRAIERNPDDEWRFLLLAAAHGYLGREDDAKAAVETFNETRSKTGRGSYTVAHLAGWSFKHDAERERWQEGLRKAGLPEGNPAGAGLTAVGTSPLTIEGATTVDPATAKTLFDRAVPFIDVRDDADWNAGYIPGAVHLELYNVFSEAKLAEVVNKDEEVVIYCQGTSCGLSSSACVSAVSWGFERVYYFREGFPGWKAAGYPIATE